MYCKNCGSETDENAAVCPKCGAPVTKPSYEKQTNTIAVVGFVLAFFIAIAGLICSIIGYRKSRGLDGTGKGFAMAGIIISAAEMVLTIIIYAVAIAGVAAAV